MTAELNVVDQKQRNGYGNGQLVAFAGSGRHSQIGSRRGVSTRIAIKAEKKILFIDAAEIVSIEARGNYVVLRQTCAAHILRQSISEVAEKLESFGFVRIHRSLIVNSLFAKEIRAVPSGDYLLRMEGGTEYTVTRTYKNNLRRLAALWLGPQFADASG